jgi:hypothetical protein
LLSLVGGAIDMIHEVPEEIVKDTRLCLHKHGCLSSCAIFPQCVTMGEKKYNGLVVKKKPYCLDECLYHVNATDQDIDDNLSLCYCPVFVNIFKVMEG